jgi:putative molybdopterin biosynthesis protein
MNTTPETATTEDGAFYTAHELAGKLKVNVMTIYRYIKAGKLTAYKFGKEFRITEENFQTFLNNSLSK